MKSWGHKGRWGCRTDAATGLLLLGLRHYDPASGRFLARDPIGQAGGAGLYAYCAADPVNRADPTGLDGSLSRSLNVGMAIWDLYDFGKTAADPCASTGDKVWAAASALPGLPNGFGSYKSARRLTTPAGQSHHLNQAAAYGAVIPPLEGKTIKLTGNILTEAGTPHWQAHKVMEEFWDQFREGGALFGTSPTNMQYTRALLDSLMATGFSREQALALVREAIKERIKYGLLGSQDVPRIPGRINLAK